jgi:FkbM family methyltransferase
MFKRISGAWGKMIFCNNITADISSFLKLIRATKLFNVYREKHPYREVYDQFLLRLAGKKVGISLRRYSGDLDIFFEIFWKRAYYFEGIEKYPVKTILDLGANIGMSSAFLYTCLPGASFFCVEPDVENMRLLKKNLGGLIPLTQQKFLEAAVGPSDSTGQIIPARYAYNLAVSIDNGPGEVKLMKIGSIIQHFGLQKIDLVKIDIEGAESFLFHETDWLDTVNSIIIEFHVDEWLRAGVSKLKEKGFSLKRMPGNDMLFFASRFIS